MNNQKNRPVVSINGVDVKNAIFNEIVGGDLVPVGEIKLRKGVVNASALTSAMLSVFSYNEDLNDKAIQYLLKKEEEDNNQECDVVYADCYLAGEFILSKVFYVNIDGAKDPLFVEYMDAQRKRLEKVKDAGVTKYFNAKKSATSSKQLFLQIGKPIEFLAINPSKESWVNDAFVLDYVTMSRYEKYMFIGLVGINNGDDIPKGASFLIGNNGSLISESKVILTDLIQEIKQISVLDANELLMKIMNSEEGDRFVLCNDVTINVLSDKVNIYKDMNMVTQKRYPTLRVCIEEKFVPKKVTLADYISIGEIKIAAKRAKRIIL